MLPQLEKLAGQDIGKTFFNEVLSRHSSWQIGGPADLLVEPSSVTQIQTLCRFVARHGIPLVTIGQGTNLLFADAGVRGVVLKLGASLSRIEIAENRIIAEAGAWVPQLARMAMQAGLSGLEHCIGIPGTLGGLVLMNGGSHRQAIGDNLRRVWLVDTNGEDVILDKAACGFAYRHSLLPGRGVVVKAELVCRSRPVGEIRREMVCDLRERRSKFPRKTPNCGSVFLSTAEMHAGVGPPGRIIEEAGLKGLSAGAAEVSRQHANFIVNTGGATAAEVLELIARVRTKVRQTIGFDLRCEVRYVHPEGRIVPVDQV